MVCLGDHSVIFEVVVFEICHLFWAIEKVSINIPQLCLQAVCARRWGPESLCLISQIINGRARLKSNSVFFSLIAWYFSFHVCFFSGAFFLTTPDSSGSFPLNRTQETWDSGCILEKRPTLWLSPVSSSVSQPIGFYLCGLRWVTHAFCSLSFLIQEWDNQKWEEVCVNNTPKTTSGLEWLPTRCWLLGWIQFSGCNLNSIAKKCLKQVLFEFVAPPCPPPSPLPYVPTRDLHLAFAHRVPSASISTRSNLLASRLFFPTKCVFHPLKPTAATQWSKDEFFCS